MTAPPTLHWDLSRDHAADRVGWPDADLTAHTVEGPVHAVLTLPAGRTFEARVARILCRRDADTLTGLDMFFPPDTQRNASDLVARLARQWDVDPTRLDPWLATQPSGLAPASTTRLDATTVDPDGPLPSIELVSSFDEALPVIVILTFTWSR